MAVEWPSARVEPGRNDNSVDACRHQHTPVKAGFAGQEALEAVDGREAGLKIVERQEFAVHGAPVVAWDAVLSRVGGCGGAPA